jgi:hypothetical protein
MNDLNTVSKPANVSPTDETLLSGVLILLVIVMQRPMALTVSSAFVAGAGSSSSAGPPAGFSLCSALTVV